MSICARSSRASVALALAVGSALSLPRDGRAQRSDSTLASWPSGDAVASPISGVALLTTSKWHVLLATPRGYNRLPIAANVRAAIVACRSSLNISESQTSRLGEVRPWSATTTRDDIVIVTIVPVLADRAECARAFWNDPAVLANGVRFTQLGDYRIESDAASAEFLVGGRALNGVVSDRAHIALVSGILALRDTVSQLRLAIPADVFRPSKFGSDDLSLQVTTALSTVVDRIPLSDSTVDVIRTAILAERIASVAPSVTQRIPVSIPTPSDAMLRTAWNAYQSGDAKQSTSLSFQRLAEIGLSETDRRAGMVQLASTLLASGDTTSARIVAQRLMRRDPCFSLSSSAPSGYRDLFADLKAPARCDSRSPATVLGAGMLFPGFGQMIAGRPAVGLLTTILTAGLAGKASSTLHHADAVYAQYQASRTAQTAAKNYVRANDLRASARMFATAAAASWAALAVEASVVEWWHGRSVHAVREYGSR